MEGEERGRRRRRKIRGDEEKGRRWSKKIPERKTLLERKVLSEKKMREKDERERKGRKEERRRRSYLSIVNVRRPKPLGSTREISIQHSAHPEISKALHLEILMSSFGED
jgi:hypothetical protein